MPLGIRESTVAGAPDFHTRNHIDRRETGEVDALDQRLERSDLAVERVGIPDASDATWQEHELELKAKMVEYKAISLGHVDALPIKQELASIKAQMMETKRMVETVNKSTMNSTLPMIREGTMTAAPYSP